MPKAASLAPLRARCAILALAVVASMLASTVASAAAPPRNTPQAATYTASAAGGAPGQTPAPLFVSLLARERPAVLSAAAASAPGRRAYYPAAVPARTRTATAQVVGQMAPPVRIQFGVQLPVTHPRTLKWLLSQQSLPGSPWYHHFLTTQQFAAAFAVTPAQYAAVAAAFAHAGLQVTPFSDRIWMGLNGTVSQAEGVFHTDLARYRLASGILAYAPTAPPSLPPSIAPYISYVSGLNDVRVVHPEGGAGPRVGTGPGASAAPSADWGPGGGGLSPAGLSAAYDIAPLQAAANGGAGVTIDIPEFTNIVTTPAPCGAAGGHPLAPVKCDLLNFDQRFGIPSAPAFTLTPVDTPSGRHAPLEVRIDVETAHAVAPNAVIQMFFAPGSFSGWKSTYATMIEAATPGHPVVVTSSWGELSTSGSTPFQGAFDGVLEEAATQGVTLVSASGDCGAYGYTAASGTCDAQRSSGLNPWPYPQVTPYVTDVGGTRLCVSPSFFGLGGTPPTTTAAEIGWQGGNGGSGQGCKSPSVAPTPFYPFVASGGGFSGYAQPTWQAGIADPSCTAGCPRGVPDVALEAAVDPGYAIFVSGGWTVAGGTSAAAPLFAAVVALTDALLAQRGRGPLGFLNPLLYGLWQAQQSGSGSGVFRSIPYSPGGRNEITASSYPSGSSCPTGYNPNATCATHPGWNSVTGLGSVDAWNFARAVLGVSYTGTSPSEPQGITAAPNGDVWYADAAANEIGQFSPATGAYTFYHLPTPGADPTGIAFDANTGNVWFTESAVGQIGEIPVGAAPGGNALEYPVPAGVSAQPTGISVDGNGRVWFAEEGNGSLGEVTGSGSAASIREFPLPSSCQAPEGAITDPGGNVWTACEGSNSIAERTAGGQTLNFPVSTAPEQLAIDPAGKVWFTEWGPAYIGELNPGLAQPNAAPNNDPGLSETPLPGTGTGTPSGIWTDSGGNVWYTDASAQAIGKLVPPAAFSFFPVPQPISTYPEGNEGNGLTIDARGNVWYAGYSGSVGYLGELAGVAAGIGTTPGGISGGVVKELLHLLGRILGTSLTIPSGTDVTLPSGMPFTGVVHAPELLASSLVPPAGGRDLVPGSAFNVAAISITGQQEHVLFSNPVTLTFPVTLPPGTPPGLAQVWYFDTATQAWKEAGIRAGDPGGVVSGGRASVQTTHLTVFAIVLAGSAPNVAAISPPLGQAGTRVALTGTNFGTHGGSVLFGTVAAPAIAWSSTRVVVSVPAGLPPGPVAVRLDASSGVRSNTVDFSVVVPPVLASLAPPSGPVGTTITLAGRGFEGPGTVTGSVYFQQGGTTAVLPTLPGETNDQAQVAVPTGLAAGSVAVAVYNATTGLLSNNLAFSVTVAPPPTPLAPVLASLAPPSGPVGTTITLAGRGFEGPGTVAGSVYFQQGGATAVLPTLPGETNDQAQVAVPTGLAAGSVAVSVYNATTGLLSNNLAFSVTVPPPPTPLAPVLASLAPPSGPVGTTITLAGRGFEGPGTVAGSVYFQQGGATAVLPTLPGETNDQAQVAVPTGLAAGSVAVAVYNATTGLLSNNLAFSVTVPVPALEFLTTSLPSATVGVPYSATALAVGGVTPYTWSLPAGSLPPGLDLGRSSGVISGTPSAAGVFTFTMEVADRSTPALTARGTVSINVAGVTVSPPGGGGLPPIPAAPAALTSQVGSLGGTLQANGCTLTIPADDVPPGTSLAIAAAPLGATGLPPGLVAVGAGTCTLTGPPLLHGPVPVSVSYDGVLLGTASPLRLSVYRRGARGRWSFLPTVVHPASGTVDAYVPGPATLAVLENPSRFRDIAPGYWARRYIDALAAASVVGGFPNGTFEPTAAVTRAEFVKMLVLTLGLVPGSGATTFTDVPATHWYAPYVSVAERAGLVDGVTPTTFAPHAPLSREQLAALLARALKLRGNNTLTFTDAAQIGHWAREAVAAAVAAGYLDGFPNGTFQPAAPTTRAQAAKVLALVIKHLAP